MKEQHASYIRAVDLRETEAGKSRGVLNRLLVVVSISPYFIWSSILENVDKFSPLTEKIRLLNYSIPHYSRTVDVL